MLFPGEFDYLPVFNKQPHNYELLYLRHRITVYGDFNKEASSDSILESAYNILQEKVKLMDINNKMIAPKQKTLNLYCYRVAGVVGLLCLSIFGENNKNSKIFGIALANALQITNILRDIKEDSLMGRLYIPKEILQKAGIEENDIKQIIKNKKFPIACKLLTQVAELNFKIAEKKLKQCNESKLKSAILMMQTYKLLLKKLKKEGWKNIGRKVRLTKLEKITLFLKVSFS